ncbi:MAG: purine-nucleoside phosphorylase [Candidatus Caldatribacteriaceae bacterium]
MDRERALLERLFPEKILRRLRELTLSILQKPSLAFVAGSGWSGCIEGEVEHVIGFSEIEKSLRSGVAGHEGVMKIMRFREECLLVMEGRLHLYEGYNLPQILAPVGLASLLGVQTIIFTNASGSLSPFLPPGSVLVLADQIDWTFIPDVFPPKRFLFDEELQKLALSVASLRNLEVLRGVYVGVLGPSYETKAEIQMLTSLGGQAVGMSTVKEAKCASYLGMRVLGLSLVTNWGAGLSPYPLSHEDVLLLAQERRPILRDFVQDLVRAIFDENRRES